MMGTSCSILITVRSELGKVSEVCAGELLQYAGSKAQTVGTSMEWEADGLCMSEPSLLTQFGGSQLRSQSWRFPVPCPDWQTEFPGEAQNDVKTQPHRTALTFDGFESPFNDSNSTNDSLCTLFYPVVSSILLRKPVLSDWRRVDGRDRVSKCLR